MENRDEEEWPLKDVIFVEDIKTVPVGKVLKVTMANNITYVKINMFCF